VHPVLIPSKRLAAARAGRIGRNAILFTVLLGVTFVAASRSGSFIPPPTLERTGPPPPAARSIAPVARPIPGTLVPRPPVSVGLTARQTPGQQGESVFSASQLPRADSVRLFEFYVESMSGGGWTLMGESQPDPRGEWALSWRNGRQVAALYLYRIPRVTFTLDYCPPLKYC
jgi:hypothetical protein